MINARFGKTLTDVLSFSFFTKKKRFVSTFEKSQLYFFITKPWEVVADNAKNE